MQQAAGFIGRYDPSLASDKRERVFQVKVVHVQGMGCQVHKTGHTCRSGEQRADMQVSRQCRYCDWNEDLMGDVVL